MAKGFGQLVLSPKEEREAKILRQSVLKHFQYLQDPRVERTQHHSLGAIVTIAILAVLSGADGLVAIETYGKAKQSWLETVWDLPNGIPSHDTFGRVMGALEPQELQERFLAWVSSITEKLSIELIIETRGCLGGARDSITPVTSAKSVDGLNHGRDGPEYSSIME